MSVLVSYEDKLRRVELLMTLHLRATGCYFPLSGHTVFPVLLTRTLEQGPGLGCQGPGQGQGLESEGQAPRQ